MNAKVLMIVVLYLYASDAAVLREGQEACADQAPLCHLFENLCSIYESVRTACPRTCGTCDGGRTDPCGRNNGECSQYCTGSLQATCSCRDGYRLDVDGKTCVDINECLEETYTCDDDTQCINTMGSYSCQAVNCEFNGLEYHNYYKSDSCCRVQSELPESRKLSDKDNQLVGLLENSQSTTQWPWMGQITSNNNQLCGGILVSSRHVVTAAVCVENAAPSTLRLYFGNLENAVYSSNRSSSRVERTVSDITIHENSRVNDIAIIELSSEVEFTDLIQPVHFPCGESPSEGETCFVTGFGTPDDSRSAVPVHTLKEVALPIVSTELCALAYQQVGQTVNTTTMMCAGHIQGGADACYGDAGGPLVCQREGSCQWYLSGIVARGRGCGRRGFPGIYTQVVHYENWIRQHLGDDYIDRC